MPFEGVSRDLLARTLPGVLWAAIWGALQNLLDNAVKFMGDQPRPRIEVGARRDEGGIVFFVRDNGVGIDSRHQQKVFGLFEKLDPQGEGTGIGLAVVKRIVETHGGTIWVESQGRGHGATFCFTLGSKPRDAAHAPTTIGPAEARERTAPAEAVPVRDGGGPR